MLLLIVAAALLSFPVGEFQDAGVIPGAGNVAFDVSPTLPDDAGVGAFLRALVGYMAAPTALQVVMWLANLVVTGALFLRPSTRAAPARPASDSRGTFRFDCVATPLGDAANRSHVPVARCVAAELAVGSHQRPCD